MVNAVTPPPGGIQIVQQIVGPNGEIQQIPIQLTSQQLQMIRTQMTGMNFQKVIIIFFQKIINILFFYLFRNTTATSSDSNCPNSGHIITADARTTTAKCTAIRKLSKVCLHFEKYLKVNKPFKIFI